MKRVHEFCEKFGYTIDKLSESHVVLTRNINEYLYIYYNSEMDVRAVRSELQSRDSVMSNNILVEELKFLVQ